MIYVSLKEPQAYALPFYLAMEEYVARHIAEIGDEAFFMWRVSPTVIFGRNQLLDNEVNVDYCQSHAINYFRRKSGGGCVYADDDNFMFSYISRRHNVSTTFAEYTSKIVEMLQGLGIADAHSSSRNDVMIGNRKVSGNAFYYSNGCSIVHGTMLFDTNMQNMLNAITPSSVKLDSKGVESVRQHITVLREHVSLSKDEFANYAKSKMCNGEFVLDEAAVKEIEAIAKPYYSKEFIFGRNPRCKAHRSGRVEGVGELHIDLDVRGNKIESANLLGDYFLIGDQDVVLNALKGVEFNYDDVRDALSEIKLDEIIYKLESTQFINILFQDNYGRKQENLSV